LPRRPRVSFLFAHGIQPESHLSGLSDTRKDSMQKRPTSRLYLLLLCVAAALVLPLQAQTAAKSKPTVYTYVAQWAVPRAQWADIVKADEADRPVLDKLVADGTLIGYGAYTNLIHQEDRKSTRLNSS